MSLRHAPPPSSIPSADPVARIGRAATVFIVLAIVHTWPLVTGLDHLSRRNDDQWLNAWAVSWVAHQLPRDPVHLFDANMFHPNERTFAYTEPLIVPGVMGAPLRWLGASSLLTYNVLLLLGLVLTALAMYLLVLAWGGDHWGGLLAGALLAFGTPMLTRLPHLQAIHLYSLPLACLAFDRLVIERRTRDAIWLGVFVLAAALTSGYLAVFVSCALGAALLARAPSLWGRDGVSVLSRLAVAASVTLAILLVVLRPYREFELERALPAGGASLVSALESYLASAANLHYETWSQPFYDRAPGTLFPGVVALALTAVGLTMPEAVTRKGVRPMLLAIAATGLVLSLGALTPVYAWVGHVVPPLLSLRAPNRFGILVLFALAVLAGLGLSALGRRCAPKWRTVGSLSVLTVATIEGLHAPIPYVALDQSPPIYDALASTEQGPVVELPIFFGSHFQRNAPYLLTSATHWRPLVNGFGGFRPPDYDDMAQVIATFPSVVAVARLRAIGVEHVIVHLARYGRPGAGRLDEITRRLRERPDLELLAEGGRDRLYRVGELPSNRVGGLLVQLPWSDLTFAQAARPGSYLRAVYGLGLTFGLQGEDQFLGYMENTATDSRLMLRLPMAMSGRFLDPTTGAVLRELTVSASAADESPELVVVPAGYPSAILELRAAGSSP